MLLSTIIVVILLLFSSMPVNADTFQSSGGDNIHNKFMQTVAYTIGELPPLSEIEYDESSVVGQEVSIFEQQHTFETVTDFNGFRHIANIGDRISGPPGTQIDILYFFKNNAEMTVNLNNIFLPLSESSLESKSISNITNISGIYIDMSVLRDQKVLHRGGMYKMYPVSKNIDADDLGSFLLERTKILSPLNIQSIDIVELENDLEISVKIENISQEYLENIFFEHLNYTETFNLNSKEEKDIKYTIPLDSKMDNLELGRVAISNPNDSTKCAVGKEEEFSLLGLYSTSVFADRLREVMISGSFVEKERGSFCITRIPYTMFSSDLIYERETAIEIEENDTPLVLGISETLEEQFLLPKTGKRGSEY